MITLVISWFVIRSFIGRDIAGDFILLFPLGIRLSGVTIAPVPDKIETSVGIFYSNNIYFGDAGSN